MIGAFLSNTPANLLRSNGVAGDNAPGAEDATQDRDQDLARDSRAGPRATALRSNHSAPLSADAVLALQEAEDAPTANAKQQDQQGQKAEADISEEPDGSAEAAEKQSAVISRSKDGSDEDGLDEAEKKQVDKLAQRDREVKAHEKAHARAGGAYAGPPSYTFQQGPDGKRYAVGGEVQIDTSAERTPEATVRKMQIVIRAATAPAEPSSQDLKVAQQARSQLSEAQAELRQKKAEQLSGDREDISGSVNDIDQTTASGPSGISGTPEYQNGVPEMSPNSGENEDEVISRSPQNDDAIAAYQSAIQRTNEIQSIFGALTAQTIG